MEYAPHGAALTGSGGPVTQTLFPIQCQQREKRCQRSRAVRDGGGDMIPQLPFDQADFATLVQGP